MSEGALIHATCVAIRGRGVLLAGRSGTGKSDLALRLIDRGAALVADDYSRIEARDGQLFASAPDTIMGRLEVRGVGLTEVAALREAPVALLLDLEVVPERLPFAATRLLGGVPVRMAALAAFEPSAAIKVELLLAGVPG